MSRENQAIVTVRFYVGQDRERSLVKLFKKGNENRDIIPPGVTGWVVEHADPHPFPSSGARGVGVMGASSDGLRRVGEEVIQRLATIPEVSRAYVVGEEPRAVCVDLDPDRLEAYRLSPLEVPRAISAANVTLPGRVHPRRRCPARGSPAWGRPSGSDPPAGSRCVRRPAGISQGRGERPRWPGGDQELRPPRLESGARLHGPSPQPRNISRKRTGLVGDQNGEHWREAVPAETIAPAKKKGTNAVALADTILR